MDLKALPNLVAIQITVIALFAVIYRHITSILNNTIRALCMDEQSFICCDCIGDLFLREQLKEDNESGVCSYCSMSGLGGSLSSVAEMVDEVYRQFYGNGESYPVFHGDSDRAEYTQSGDSPEYIINMMLKSEEPKISDDIFAYLADEESYPVMKDGAVAMYDSTSCYQHIDVGPRFHNELWKIFCKDIKHGARFFSSEAKFTLDEVFKNINDYSTSSGKKPIGLMSGREIFRARKANTFEDIKKVTSAPQAELAAPPSHLTGNGRMNPVGISMFYGAFDQDTCISELRPAVGETIVCGAFRETKPLRVFDFTVLNEVYSELSMFDPDYPEKLSQLSFLRSFESIISKAFLPHDTTLEYLPLQAMTEYLSRFVDGGVDALIYPSAQREGVKQKNN